MRPFNLVIGGLVAGGLALGAIVYLSGGPGPNAPTLFEWEDYVQAPFLAAYERDSHEKPKTSIFADEDEAFAKLRAGFKPDVMGPCYYEFPRWQEAGLLQPVETAKLKNWEKLSPSLRALPGLSAGEGKVWFVPHYWGNTSITYRTDLAPEYVGHESWNILFDPKYKGRVAVLEGVDDTVPFIAKMIGVDAYNMSNADWDRVKTKLKEVIGQVRFVSSDETSLAQGLASGEIVAAMSWRVTFRTLKAQGKPVAYMNPPGGIFTYVCGLTVAKSTENYDKALSLLDSEIADEAADFMVRQIGDGPANVEQLVKEPDSVFETLGIPRDVETFLKSGTFQRRLKNKDTIVNAWSEIRAGL